MKITIAILAAIAVFFTPIVNAGTGCDEWAAMTQVLVARWQNDVNFKNNSLEDVKKALTAQMAGHPELKIALKWVDYAYKHKNEDYRDIYKTAYNQCSTQNAE